MMQLIRKTGSGFLASRGLDLDVIRKQHPYHLVNSKRQGDILIGPEEIERLQSLPPQKWIPMTYQGIEVGDSKELSESSRLRFNIHFAIEEFAVEATTYELGRMLQRKTSEAVRKRIRLRHVDLDSEGSMVWRKKKPGGPRNLNYLGLQLIDDRHFKNPNRTPLYDPRLDGSLYINSVKEALDISSDIFPEDKFANRFLRDGAFGLSDANLWLWATSDTYEHLKTKRGSLSGIDIGKP